MIINSSAYDYAGIVEWNDKPETTKEDVIAIMLKAAGE
jgi:hypothetical protein